MGKMTRLMFLWATLGCGAAWGQSDGFIEGTVTEETEAALPGANIAVRSPAEDYKTGTTADADGQFRIAVPAGNYQVEITFVGYKSDLRENVQVRAGQTTRLDAVLVEQVIFLAQSVVSASRRQEKILDAPASVSVVEGSEIRNNPALSLSDHVKNLPAVDIAKRGLANANVVVRGFNNIFSGTLLTFPRRGGADIALNAPRHKVKLGMDYNFAEWGLALGGQVRYIDSFPMSSGVYVGEVDSYTVLDLNLTYQLPLEQDLVLQVDADNALDQAYQSFVGAPAVGRLVFGQVGLRF